MPTDKRDTNEAYVGYRIRVTHNGPYLVYGGVPLAKQIIVSDEAGNPVGWRQGQEYPVRDPYALCRCGHSKKPPFCDGTHAEVHFDGTQTAVHGLYLEWAEKTEGPALDLRDMLVLCANAGFCTPHGGTWDLTLRSGDPQARRMAIEQARHCPSGRLVAYEKDGAEIEPELAPSIGLVENPLTGARGPIWVRGGIVIEGEDGRPYEVRNRVTLCGCGKSIHKPFCSGCHSEE